VYTIRHGLAKGLKRKGGLSFVPQLFDLSEEEKFLASLDFSNKSIYDVGAANGLLTLFFARATGGKGEVAAFEPNSILCNSLKENVALNSFDNVSVFQVALGCDCRKEKLVFPSSIPGVGSLESHEKSRIIKLKDARVIEVQVASIDHLVTVGDLFPPDFVKIDVQCLELDVLMGMRETLRQYHPKLFVEVHSIPDVDWKKENVLKVITFLQKNGYSAFHVESNAAMTLLNLLNIKANDHLYCEYAGS